MGSFPISIVSNPDTTSGNTLNNPDHAGLHSSHNAEILAVETKIGTGSSTPTTGKVLRATGTGTSGWGQTVLSTDVATATSADLRGVLSDETGTGSAVFGTAPTIGSPAITTPSIITSINDANANEVIKTPATASAVNEITVTNAATGNSPIISATGDDSNVGLTLTPKGTSGVTITKRFDGWVTGLPTPNTVTALGNRSYSLVFNTTDLTSTLSAGMRLRTQRTVVAPTQCTSLNGTTQYYSKTSPAGMTFTDDFTVSAWVKLSSYAQGAIASRFDGTSGWIMQVNASGQVLLNGYNASGSNTSGVTSYQSIPLNKWIHVTAQLDMSAFTATTTTSYVMIDGVDVPASVSRSGTNPTALVQAGNLNIGAFNAGGFFPGKIAQVAIYSAKVTQATILASMHQGLAGTETFVISAYSFNGVLTDLNANANTLTANGSAVATNADSPFGYQAGGAISSTLDYGIVQSATFSTNTTVVVQVPEGCTIPTSGGVSAVSYSSNGAPYGFPKQRGKWTILSFEATQTQQTSAVNGTWYNVGNHQLNIPIGEWQISYQNSPFVSNTSGSIFSATLSTANNTESIIEFTTEQYFGATTTGLASTRYRSRPVSLTAATIHYLNLMNNAGTSTTISNVESFGRAIIEAENAYL